MRKSTFVAALLVLMLLVSCNSGGKPAAPANTQQVKPKEAAAPEYITGRAAFQKLLVASRAFAPDIKPYRLDSNYTPGAPADGRAGLWRGQFASPTRGAIKTYSWSGVGEADNRGVTHGTEDTYNPANTSTQIFELAFLKTDSDKAFEVAQKHGGEKLTKKDSKQPVIYILEFNRKKNELVWYVVYGENRNDSKLTVAVNATTGAFLRVEH